MEQTGIKKRRNLMPINYVFLSFIALIFFGATLLLLPISTVNGIGCIDAIFTSTSAVCVTGLIVLDTAKDFTLFGRFIILLLIQLGGLGIMTFSLGLFSIIGGSLSIKWRFTFEEIYSNLQSISIKSILKRIIKYTFYIEFFTACILFTQFYQDHPLGRAIEHSVFNAVSAFCNAGFSTFSNSLISYKDNSIIVLTIAISIILGGLGFVVLNESALIKKRKLRSFFFHLSIHSRLVLIITFILIAFGMLSLLFLEWRYAFKELSFGDSLLTALFQSITCRTAGFSTIDIASLRESSQFIMIFLMFIGGSPGSVAGGIKTTSIGVIFLLIYSRFRNENQIKLWNRSLHSDVVDRSTSLMIISFVFISLTILVMLTIADFDIGHSFLSIMFETVSAFGTVGLSMGITDQLPELEKILLSFVMLIGRLGPLTLIMALTLKKKNIKIEYPKENIMIG